METTDNTDNSNKTNINDLIEQGKKQLADLQQQIERLADTAGKVAGIAADELNKKADELIKEASVHVEKAKTTVEEKTKDAMASDEYKNFETQGKKAVEEAQIKIDELSKQATDLANDFGNKLRDIFGKK
jgi:ElaB/YqjD/DUF883 family membrane-anchored ribosome-binding protein